MRLITALAVLCLSAQAYAIQPPEVTLSVAGPGEIRVVVDGVERASGYNIYQNGNYYHTVLAAANQNSFVFYGGSASYCIVRFINSNQRVDYSTCSNSISLESGSVTNQQLTPGSDTTPPSQPDNLRAVFYSPNVADIVWDAASDNEYVAGYKIWRNDSAGEVVDQRSIFEPALVPGQLYTYKVAAIDGSGNEGPSANLSFINGTESLISVPQSRYVLQEGASRSLRIPIALNDGLSDNKPVELSFRSLNEVDFEDLTYYFESSTLSQSRQSTQLKLRLKVGTAPRTPHQRKFIVTAKSGELVSEKQVTLNVQPIAAPDIYLLIGQSNMEGASEESAKNSRPGGPDEPNSRIWQLNVEPNSQSIFKDSADFTNESLNFSTPMFVTAEDPLHQPRFYYARNKSGTRIGPGLSFAKTALNYTTQDIYLVPAAWGATAFCANQMEDVAWNAHPTSIPELGGTLLVDRALTRLNMTLRSTGGVFRGILWHQGESDSNNMECADHYSNNLALMVERLRNDARPDKKGSHAKVPFIAGTMSKGDDNRGRVSRFSAAKSQVDFVHRNVDSLISHADFVNNDDLVPDGYSCGQGSCIHFGAAAQRTQGYRFYQALHRVLNR